MEIWHHIAFNSGSRPDLGEAVAASGLMASSVKAPGGRSSVIALEIPESHPQWPWFRERLGGVVDIAYTQFTAQETLGARWTRLIPTFEQGYPHPKDTWAVDRTNFLSVCSECGIEVQTSPFQVGVEPRMEKSDFLTLFWSNSLFATTRTVNALVERGFTGFEPWKVLVAKTGIESAVVEQMHTTAEVGLGFIAETVATKRCPTCGRSKFGPHRIGAMAYSGSAFDGLAADLAQTKEWFGDGKNAFREFVASHRLAEYILGTKLRGVSLQPIRLVD